MHQTALWTQRKLDVNFTRKSETWSNRARFREFVVTDQPSNLDGRMDCRLAGWPASPPGESLLSPSRREPIDRHVASCTSMYLSSRFKIRGRNCCIWGERKLDKQSLTLARIYSDFSSNLRLESAFLRLSPYEPVLL